MNKLYTIMEESNSLDFTGVQFTCPHCKTTFDAHIKDFGHDENFFSHQMLKFCPICGKQAISIHQMLSNFINNKVSMIPTEYLEFFQYLIKEGFVLVDMNKVSNEYTQLSSKSNWDLDTNKNFIKGVTTFMDVVKKYSYSGYGEEDDKQG